MLINLKNILLLIFIFLSFSSYSHPNNSIYNLDIELVDNTGKKIHFSDLKGKIHILSMVYTNCRTICPVIISNMKSIEKLIPANSLSEINFTLITLDPERDTVSNLKIFFLEKKFSKNWHLYRTTKENTLKLALTFGVKFKKEKKSEYTHSNLIIIIDKNGIIRMAHQGLDKNYSNLLKLIEKLK